MDKALTLDLKAKVAQRAYFRCEYCLIAERFLATVFHIDHIRSKKHGGQTIIDNLAYACPHCNQHKGTDVATFINDEGFTTIRLFNPRIDDWNIHFQIFQGEIVAKTDIGIATLTLLQFNQPDRLILRRELDARGLYP
jgi:hypothetical protein